MQASQCRYRGHAQDTSDPEMQNLSTHDRGFHANRCEQQDGDGLCGVARRTCRRDLTGEGQFNDGMPILAQPSPNATCLLHVHRPRQRRYPGKGTTTPCRRDNLRGGIGAVVDRNAPATPDTARGQIAAISWPSGRGMSARSRAVTSNGAYLILRPPRVPMNRLSLAWSVLARCAGCCCMIR